MKKKRRNESTQLPADLPDRRATEGAMQSFVAGIHGKGSPDTPLEQAQSIMYRAFEQRDAKKRVELAKEALALSPDCADAYVLLAEYAPSCKQALNLYEKAVAAGERALGPKAFQRDAGHFWGILKTRPFMRAKVGLADALWTAGRRDEAVRHLQEMLRLNPNDNQGIRYTLAGYLLFLDRDDDLSRLIDQFAEEGSASWAYNKALLAFRQEGDTITARRVLKLAKKTNKHIPDYLLGKKAPPASAPSYYSPGEENEAWIYINTVLAGWKSTPGAIAWLRANVKGPKKAEVSPPKGPLGFIKQWLKSHLSRQEDVWQADVRQLPNWMPMGGEPVRPWVMLVTNRTNEFVLAHQLLEEMPSSEQLWDILVQAMQHSAAGEAHRPGRLQVRPGEVWKALKPHLEEIGIELVEEQELDLWDAVFHDLCEHVCGQPQPGLLSMPGVAPEQVGSFFEGAALFFKQAPWKQVGIDAIIQVECDQFQSGPWYAVLMGQSGLSTGVALYQDLAALRRLLAGKADEKTSRDYVGTSVLFGEAWEIAVADLEAANQYGWAVARSDAYPLVIHKERSQPIRPPLGWELQLMEACLRTIPGFVNRLKQGDPARETLTVPAGSGSLTVGLTWIADDEPESMF